MKMVNVIETVPVRMALAVSVVILFLMALLNSAFGASAEDVYASLAKMSKAERQKTILERAQKEGKVMVYGATEESIAKAIIAGFHKKHPGIKVEYLREVSTAILSKAMMEVNAGRWGWDLLSVGPGYTEVKQAKAAARHYGLVADEEYPKQFIGGDWFGFEILPLVIAYNKSLVKPADVPKSYADLLDPKWKAKAAIDVNPDNLLTAMIKKWGKEKTANWLDKFMNENQALIRRGHTVQTQLLASGEYPIASEVYAYRVEQLMEKGAQIDWIVPADVAEAEVPGYVISRQAPNPYAALLFAQYRTSTEGQSIGGGFGRIGVHPQSELKYPRLRELVKNPTLERLTLITVEDQKLWDQAGELIQKYVAPRVRAK
jgi:iron(III) transport system substrate-binding protein